MALIGSPATPDSSAPRCIGLPERHLSTSSDISEKLVLFALWFIATAWNYGKAFHIDDTAHLEIARWIAGHPLHPMQGHLNWVHDSEPISALNQPHLFFYLMAAVGSVFGWQEPSMHILESCFTALAVIFTYKIARHISRENAIVVTMLAMLSPALVVNQNVMVDVPLLAMVTGFYWALLASSASLRRRYYMAALMVSVAVMIKYSGIVLLPALYLDMTLRGQLRYWRAGIIPVVALLAWSGFNLLDYGHIHILERPLRPGDWAGTMPERAVALLLCLGASAPFALLAFPGAAVGREKAAAWWFERAIAFAPALLIAIAAAFAITSAFDGATYGAVKITLAISAVTVIFAGVKGIAGQNRTGARLGRADLYGLLYWATGFFVFNLYFAPFAAVRHVLPSVIALLILSGAGPAGGRWRIAAVGMTSVWLSVVAAGDWWSAAAYRGAAEIVRKAVPAHATVWFSGHWGWQWYSQQLGMQRIGTTTSQLTTGDYVVWPMELETLVLPEGVRLQKETEVIIRRSCCAGYFVAPDGGWYMASYWRLPWVPTRAPLDIIGIYRVVAARQ